MTHARTPGVPRRCDWCGKTSGLLAHMIFLEGRNPTWAGQIKTVFLCSEGDCHAAWQVANDQALTPVAVLTA